MTNDANPKPHDDDMIEVSPNEKYLVTYNKKNRSIVGWNVDDKDKLKHDRTKLMLSEFINISGDNPLDLNQICVSDDKRLACIYNERTNLIIINMNNNKREMKMDGAVYNVNLSFNSLYKKYKLYGTFNLNNEFLVYKENQDTFGHKIKLYRENNKWFEWSTSWRNKINYEVPNNVKFFDVSKYNKLYLFSNEYFCEWNIYAKNGIILKNELDNKIIKMSSNEKFVCVRSTDKIFIHSAELEIPIASLNIQNGDIQLHNFMEHTGLYPLLLRLFNYAPSDSTRIWYRIMDCCWKKLNDRNDLLLPDNIHVATKYAFGIRNGYVWKIKLREKISKAELCLRSDEETTTYDHLNNRLFCSYMDTIRDLFKKVIQRLSEINSLDEFDLPESDGDWNIETNNENIELQVLKENELIATKEIDVKILGIRSFNHNNDIVILTTTGLFIYTFNERRRSISLTYFYSIKCPYYEIPELNNFSSYIYIIFLGSPELIYNLLYPPIKRYRKSLIHYEKVLSKSTLPLPNFDSFKLNNELVSYVNNNKESLLIYGAELLTFAIKEHRLDLIDDIYKKCIVYFKEDYSYIFLSIIITTMPLFNEYYPEYITKYSLDTTMITDSPSYRTIYHQKYHDNLHLYSFSQHPEIANLKSWKSNNDTMKWYILYEIHPIIFSLLFIIELIITILSGILFYGTFMIEIFIDVTNELYNFDDNFDTEIVREMLFTFNTDEIYLRFAKNTTAPIIILMNPYIKFVNYPKDYNTVKELIMPQPSPFVETINSDIYKTWNGEALINFKWFTYGIYYYALIWLIFTTFLVCFTAVATIPQEHLNEVEKRNLLIASIILGFFHLSFEFRQFIYNPSKWFHNYWNFFDLGAYLVPTITSIYWLWKNNVEIFWLSFSCLLLDLKFLLFLRAFESFGVYFAIIIGVAKRIFYFLVILFIIIISFAHAFLILLRPKLDYSLDQPTINNDTNNPWNLTTTYNKIENETIVQDASFVQVPDENTNMFTNYKTALFAMYLFLTGDTSALTNKWEYKENPALVIYILLFSFLIVIYLMNLFIGLLNMAIEKENNRVSYLVQKAEILAEIELFYMLPQTRRREDLFPTNAIYYYYADVIKTRKKVKELINEGEWNANEFQDMKKNLSSTLNLPT